MVNKYETDLLSHLRTNCQKLLDDITENDRKVEGELEESIRGELESFTKNFV